MEGVPVASKILPNSGNAATPLRSVGSALGNFMFWLAVAIFFPYPFLAANWPAGAAWAPLVLYGLAFLNLIRAGLLARKMVRLKRPNPSAGRGIHPATTRPAAARSSARAGTPAQTADRASRAEARAAKDDRRNAALPHITRPPTVQRMR
jgi:hypothetical protein